MIQVQNCVLTGPRANLLTHATMPCTPPLRIMMPMAMNRKMTNRMMRVWKPAELSHTCRRPRMSFHSVSCTRCQIPTNGTCHTAGVSATPGS